MLQWKETAVTQSGTPVAGGQKTGADLFRLPHRGILICLDHIQSLLGTPANVALFQSGRIANRLPVTIFACQNEGPLSGRIAQNTGRYTVVNGVCFTLQVSIFSFVLTLLSLTLFLFYMRIFHY
ncbi:unnamed protein product [Gongylonema pulchrum]|uniref:Uncharacterized protein n=1 Tax=Gongylonema pulchrum TaxID=637853 RepID=A0A183D4M6_9BILA|nr:unnamed protein product [Gongylonema pulchrum]